MTAPRHNDLLLLAGRAIAILLQGAMAIGAIALLFVIPAVLFFQDKIVTEYASKAGNAAAQFPVLSLVGIMLIGLAIVALLFVFFGKLRQIIATVGAGDPFEPANAERLGTMAG